MKNVFFIITISFFICACQKDEGSIPPPTPEPPCQNLQLTGDLNRLVGKWQWVSTSISYQNQFDCSYYGEDIIHPSDTNFTFGFEVQQNGEMDIYRNSSLIDILFFTKIEYAFVDDLNVLDCRLYYNCLKKTFDIQNHPSGDTIVMALPQLNFNNENQTKQGSIHTFVRE